jgi:hypothetical protein
MFNPFPSLFLRRVLLADAVLSGATGLLQLLATAWLAGMLHLPAPLLQWTGLILVLYAAGVAYLGRSPRPARAGVWAVIAVNLLWAVACIGLLLLGVVSPNALGTSWVLMQAVVVVVFAGWQYLALRRSTAVAA